MIESYYYLTNTLNIILNLLLPSKKDVVHILLRCTALKHHIIIYYYTTQHSNTISCIYYTTQHSNTSRTPIITLHSTQAPYHTSIITLYNTQTPLVHILLHCTALKHHLIHLLLHYTALKHLSNIFYYTAQHSNNKFYLDV